MTIPIQLPQIQPPLAPRQPGLLEMVGPILEQITQQKVANAQLENYRNLAEERKMAIAKQAQELQDQADAAKAFYQHLSGAATTLKPEPPSKDGMPSHQGINAGDGTLLPLGQYLRSLSPGAAVGYQKLITDYNASVLQGHQATASRVEAEHNKALTALTTQQTIAEGAKNAATTQATADAATTQNILQGSDLTTDAGQLKAVRRVLQQVGPTAAEPIARALNTGTGFDKVIGPDGYLYVGHLGKWQRDAAIGQREGLGQVRLEAIKRSAGTIVDLLDAQQQIVSGQGIEGAKNPVIAQMLQDARVLGLSTEAAANLFRSDPQQATQMLKTRFVHNYIGLLANARSSGPLLQNLGESYWPVGVSDAVLQQANRDRQKLRAIMVGVRDGKITDLNRIPGFSASLSAAAQEGQSVPAVPNPTAPPDPDNYYRPPTQP